jgi:hypothetical protein
MAAKNRNATTLHVSCKQSQERWSDVDFGIERNSIRGEEDWKREGEDDERKTSATLTQRSTG